MACPCCYQSVARSVVTTDLPATGLTLKLISPSSTVETIIDPSLESSLKATVDLDSVAFDLSAKPRKDASTIAATIRPNLSQYGVKVEIYPFKGGNFKVSRPFCLCKLGSLDLAYTSADTKLTGKYRKSGEVGPLTFIGDADFTDGLAPAAVSLTLGYGLVKTKLTYTTKVPLAGTVFVTGKEISFGGGAEFVGGQIASPKIYGKYSKNGVSVAAIVAPSIAGSAASVDIRAEKKCECSAGGGAGTLGGVLSYAKGKPVASLGGNFAGAKLKLAWQVSTAGTASVTYGGNLPNGSYAVSAKWGAVKFNIPGITPSIAVNVTLGKK
jgi:hypothetical protein